MVGRLHIVGAGVAGLACAATAVQKNLSVSVYEATRRAGGRCRSFHDESLGMTLDNGSHVVLGGNPAVFKYLSLIGATEELVSVNSNAGIEFIDLSTKEHWTLKPGSGRIPWFLLAPNRRPPQTHFRHYAKALGLAAGVGERSVADVLAKTDLAWSRFWEPLSTAIMNTPADQASGKLLGSALARAITSRKAGLNSFVPRNSLSKTFIDPALAFIAAREASVQFDCPLINVEGDTRATRMNFRNRTINLASDDTVILAVPPWTPAAKPFLPEGFTPSPSPIINVHYEAPRKVSEAKSRMKGMVGGRAQWIFTQQNIISVTISADKAFAERDQTEIANLLWADVLRCFGWDNQTTPRHRVIVERRATPIQDNAFEKYRPGNKTRFSNVFLAGDWTATGLPCTLESAVLSGFEAAKLASSAA